MKVMKTWFSTSKCLQPSVSSGEGGEGTAGSGVCELVAQSCLNLCNPMDCSPPDSSVPGILQARILAWVAASSSKGSPKPGIKPRSPALQADSLPSDPPVNPNIQRR